MKRFIIDKLVEWKDSKGRKPLLVRGARQVGKTYIIQAFGREYFNKIHQLNFERNPEIAAIFEKNLDSKRIIAELELFLGQKIVASEDLLFFDEIQACPKAILALRYFYEENPELHLISAGSLLEFALKEISFPVGRIQMLNMHPMNFKEFLLASGKELMVDKISDFNTIQENNIIGLINDEMYKYFIVGGMPECVQTFIDSGSYIESIQVQKDLISTFRQDFSKYAQHADKNCLNTVLTGVAQHAGEQIKYAKLDNNFSGPTIKKAFDLMETARLFTKVRAASPAGSPLGASASEKKFKTIFLDIGLLSCLNGFYAATQINKTEYNANYKGKMAEQFVGQELRSSLHTDIYYWKREAKGSSAETDFLVEHNAEIIPIEVKSGKAGRLRSLHLLLESFPKVKRSIVFTENKFGELKDERIQFLPIFYAHSIFK